MDSLRAKAQAIDALNKSDEDLTCPELKTLNMFTYRAGDSPLGKVKADLLAQFQRRKLRLPECLAMSAAQSSEPVADQAAWVEQGEALLAKVDAAFREAILPIIKTISTVVK